MASQENVNIRLVSKHYVFDFATVFGLIIGFAFVVIAIASGGGSFQAFINPPSMMIVFGGTLGVLLACFSLRDLLDGGRYAWTAVARDKNSPQDVAEQLLQMSQVARSRGMLQFQNTVQRVTGQPLLTRALRLIAEGATDADIDRILSNEAKQISSTRERSIMIMRRGANLSPAMGLIGTLIGLVQMLSQLDDPSTIGPSMAIALLTTFYGVILSNMIFTPLVSKLEQNSEEEDLINRLYRVAAVSIRKQENPRRLEMLLNALLPTRGKLKEFD